MTRNAIEAICLRAGFVGFPIFGGWILRRKGRTEAISFIAILAMAGGLGLALEAGRQRVNNGGGGFNPIDLVVTVPSALAIALPGLAAVMWAHYTGASRWLLLTALAVALLVEYVAVFLVGATVGCALTTNCP